MNQDDREQTEQLLTQAMADEAARVETSPGALQNIQRRTRTSSSTRGRWVLVAAGAGLATAAVVTGIVLVGRDGSSPSSTPPVDAPSSVGQEPDVTLTIWYMGPKPGNPEGPGPGSPDAMPRLFEETRTLPGIGKPAGFQAVHEFLTAAPIDPDYETGWPQGVDVKAITTSDGTTTIELRGNADLESRGDLDPGQARAAIQALVATSGVTTDVRFVYNAEPLTTLLGRNVSAPVVRMSEDDTRAWISIEDVTDGQTLTNPVSIGVSGNVFEGTVNWKLTDEHDAMVDEGFVTAGSMEWADADVQLGTLEPGTYTFAAYEVSVADNDVINLDTKTFVVD